MSAEIGSQTVVQKTILAAEHEKLGAKMVDFAGWWMPVTYEGLAQEHKTVRTAVGLFDVSHMGEIFVRGPKSLATLQWLTSNDVSKLQAGQAHYSLLTNDKGGMVDDIIVYCIKPNEEYLVCVNAANIEKDWNWMVAHNREADLKNESSAWSQIAVQGPKAMELLARIFSTDILQLKTFHVANFIFEKQKCLVARTGYTGEDGCEVFLPNSAAVSLWRTLLKQGEDLGVKPIGLGARDTLRTEMKYSLYGHEIDDTTNPYEAGLGWVTKLDKGDFVGCGPIRQVKEKGVTRKLIGFKLLDKGIPRADYQVFSFDNQQIGKVTSGTLSPSLNESIGVAYVTTQYAEIGSEIWIDIRGRKAKAKVVKTPFVNARGA